jgi:hypothetical protein
MTEEDLTPAAPLVLVTTGATDAELEAAELDCAAATLDETFEEELATEDELFRAGEEAWPRVAVTEGFVLELELLTLEDDCLLEAVETFEEDLEADFAEVVVVLTDDALVLDTCTCIGYLRCRQTRDRRVGSCVCGPPLTEGSSVGDIILHSSDILADTNELCVSRLAGGDSPL